jgi:putative transposase
MVSFIDEHRIDRGVEPICKQLPIAPSTNYEHKSRERDPGLASERSKRDQQLEIEIQRV